MLTVEQVSRLELKWAFAFDGDIAAFANQQYWIAHCSSAAPAASCTPSTSTAAACIGCSRRTDRCAPLCSRSRSATGTR